MPRNSSNKEIPTYIPPGSGQIDISTGLEEGKSRSTKPIKPNVAKVIPDYVPKGNISQIGSRDDGFITQGLLSENIGSDQQAYLTSTGMEGARQQRAELQSGWEQAGHAAAKIAPKILFEITEQAGYLFDLQAHFDTLTGKGNDYSNAITQFAQAGKETMDEWAPVYRENPNEVFDLSDPAWWINNAEGLITSVAAFAATGMGVGGLFGKGASMLAKTVKAGAKAEGLLRGAAMGATAMELAYTEGAMSGAQVYKTTYDDAIEKGYDGPTAIKMASEAAATTVRLNTVLITGLNLTGAAAFIRPSTSVKKIGEVFNRKAGESLSAWRTRLATQEATKPMINATLLEMGQESLEEVVNEVASGVGEFQGKKAIGTLTGDELSGGYLMNVIETLSKSETGLAAILGAVGGGGQKFVTSFTKSSKERAAQEKLHQQNQVSHLIARIEKTEEAQKRLQKAAETGDQVMFEQAQYDLFGQQAFESFVNGTSGAIAQIYDEIAALSPEEATARGFSTKDDVHNYRTRAQEASKDIKKLEDDYQRIVHSHNAYDDEARAVGYGEAAFLMHLQKYGSEKFINALDTSLSRISSEHSKNLRARGITDLTLQEAIDHNNNVEALNLALSREDQEIDEIRRIDARKYSGKQELLSKYGHPPKGTSLKNHAIKTLLERNEKLRLDLEKSTAKIINAKKEFLAKGNDVKDFSEALQLNSFEKQNIVETKAALAKTREDLINLDKAYKEFTSKEGRDKFVKEKTSELNEKVNERKKQEEEAKRKQKEEEEKRKREAIAEKERLRKEREEAERLRKEQLAQQQAQAASTQTVPSQEPVVEQEPEEKSEEEHSEELSDEEIAEQERLKKEKEGVEVEDGDVSSPKKSTVEEAVEIIEDGSTSDMLVISAADTVAYLSKPYEEEDGKKITRTNEKNPNLVLELESPTVFKYGTELILEVDKSATWVDDNGVTKSYNDYVNPQTGEVDVNNVPIAIKDNSGRIVGYLRTVDWILRPYGPGGFANVANENDPRSPLYENAKKQAIRNIKIRNFILANNGPVRTTISSKSSGVLSRNMENGEKALAPMASVTPGINTLTVVKKGQFHSGTEEVHSSGPLLNSEEFLSNLHSKNGHVFIPVPSPNGSTLMVPVFIPTLSQNQVDTILHAFELLLNPSDPRAQFKEGDLYDFGSIESVFNLISNITYIVSDSAKSFQDRVDAEGGSASTVHLSLDKKTGIISFAKQGKKAIQIATLEDFNANKELLKQTLLEKLFSVKLSAINKSDPAYEMVYNEETQSLEEVPHNSYNDYVKQHIKVDIIGTPIGNGEHSYFDQPVIQFSTSFLGEETQPKEKSVKELFPEESDYDNLIDKLDKLVEYFEGQGKSKEEAEILAYEELSESETNLLDSKTESVPTQQPTSTVELKAKNPKTISGYLGTPNSDGSFDKSSERKTFAEGSSIMAFEPLGNNRFAVYIDQKNPSAAILALQYRDRRIEPLFDAIAAFNNSKTIQVVKPAIVELQGDKYVLVEKGTIDYDNVGITKENNKLKQPIITQTTPTQQSTTEIKKTEIEIYLDTTEHRPDSLNAIANRVNKDRLLVAKAIKYLVDNIESFGISKSLGVSFGSAVHSIKTQHRDTNSSRILNDNFEKILSILEKEEAPEQQSTTVQQSNVKMTQINDIYLTSAFVEYLDDVTKEPCIPTMRMDNGGRFKSFTKGSQWQIVKDLKGYPSHKEGGVNLNIGPNQTKIEVEKDELFLKNKIGDHVIIPKKYRIEVLDMIKEKCYNCIDALVETLPVIEDYNK